MKLTHFKCFPEEEFMLAELWSGSSQVKSSWTAHVKYIHIVFWRRAGFFPFILTICWFAGCVICVLAAAALYSILTEVTVLKSHWNGPNRLYSLSCYSSFIVFPTRSLVFVAQSQLSHLLCWAILFHYTCRKSFPHFKQLLPFARSLFQSPFPSNSLNPNSISWALFRHFSFSFSFWFLKHYFISVL